MNLRRRRDRTMKNHCVLDGLRSIFRSESFSPPPARVITIKISLLHTREKRFDDAASIFSLRSMARPHTVKLVKQLYL
jgi:hypothetical protein